MLTIAGGVFVGGLALVVLGPLVLAMAWAIFMIPFWILGALLAPTEHVEPQRAPVLGPQSRRMWREWYVSRGEHVPDRYKKLPGE